MHIPLTPALVNSEPIQGATPDNTDVLSIARRSVDIVRVKVTLLTRFEIEAILKKENASTFSIPIEVMPPYPGEVAAELYSSRYRVPKFQKFDDRKKDSREYVVHFLHSGTFTRQTIRYLREFSKSFINRAYT